MKKLVLFAAFAAVLGLSSCTNKAKVDSTTPEATEQVQPETTPAATPDTAAVATPDTTVVAK